MFSSSLQFIKSWFKYLTWSEVLVICRHKTVWGPEGPIMSQFTIVGILGFNLRLHFFYRDDGDFYHNHPRGFISLCLCGAYCEKLWPVGERIVKAGVVTVRRASQAHNVEPIQR